MHTSLIEYAAVLNHGLCCSKAFILVANIYEHTDCSVLNDGFAYRLVVKQRWFCHEVGELYKYAINE